jgi:hypothetical protein
MTLALSRGYQGGVKGAGYSIIAWQATGGGPANIGRVNFSV